MSKEEVVLLDFWASPFAMRAKIAMAEKGIQFEARQEDLPGTKSELLLRSNPVHKKVPVLLHNGNAISESFIILSYIEEAWPAKPLLPECTYQRSLARFWADFTDKKVYEGGSKIWKNKGDVQEAAKKEFIEGLKLLEEVLGEKEFFGEEVFGFLDVVVMPLTSWFYAYETFGGFSVADECPQLSAWIKRCLERESVAKALPDPPKVYEFLCLLKKKYGYE